MGRLTQYFEVGAYTEKQNIIDVSDKLPLFEKGVLMGKAIDRLAEFEDFMEENKIQDLDVLKLVIELGIKDRQTMQKYLSMWNKLKTFIKSDLEDDTWKNRYVVDFQEDLLDKMQELEQGGINEK